MSGKPVASEGSFTGVGDGLPFAPRGKYNAALMFEPGPAVGTVVLERSFNQGAVWHPVVKPDFTLASFTASTSFSGEEPEEGVLYRFRCSAYTSGTIGYRLSQ